MDGLSSRNTQRSGAAARTRAWKTDPMTTSYDDLAAALAEDSPAPIDPNAVWIERVGARQYVGFNGRGARVEIGSGEHTGRFTPGELLKVALVGCTGLSSDVAFARRLGPDYAARIDVHTVKNEEEERYGELVEKLEVDLSALAPDARDRLLALVNKAIDTSCTVGRTIKTGATVTLSIVDKDSGETVSHVSEDGI